MDSPRSPLRERPRAQAIRTRTRTRTRAWVTVAVAISALALAAPPGGSPLAVSSASGQGRLSPSLAQNDLTKPLNQVVQDVQDDTNQVVNQVLKRPPGASRPGGGSSPSTSKPSTGAKTNSGSPSRSRGGGTSPPRSGGGGASGGSGSGGGKTSATRERPRARTGRRAAIRRAARRRAADPRRPKRHRPAAARPRPRTRDSSRVSDTVRRIVEVVPLWARVAIGGLGLLSLLLGGGYVVSLVRARSLVRQRGQLLQDVGVLQAALLPAVPETLGALHTSVAYRPAEGLAAGGDFYDALELGEGRVGFILGDVSGHGKQALARTAFMRYTLRAYLEAGLEPRKALQVAGRAVGDDLGGEFATVLLAVHDPEDDSLTFACAGHPPPIVTGPDTWEPILVGSSPPIGVGAPTGLRQTTLPLPPATVACFYTDGLSEARTNDVILGRGRLSDIVGEIGRGLDAEDLLDRVASESERVADDMAAILITPTSGATAGGFRTEQLELDSADLRGDLGERFLDAAGAPAGEAHAALEQARDLADHHGSVVLGVTYGVGGNHVRALPGNVETLLDATSRRTGAGVR